MGRLFLLLVVMLGLAPGTWLRSPLPALDDRQILTFRALPAPRQVGGLQVFGAWELASPNQHFHGYSALAALGDGTLFAASDRGRFLRFSPPGGPELPPVMGDFASAPGDKRLWDIEAITRDPASGRMWLAYEGPSRIERQGPGQVARIRPAAMRSWPPNTGAEAMTRLPDGRFIVLSEGSPRWFARALPGLLFQRDPLEGEASQAFRFVPPEGFRPVDMAALPDGRVLVLLRRLAWGWPPRFSSKLVLADPREIRPGGRWSGEVIADLAASLPTDNYEGLAVEPGPGGAVMLWLISDDNAMRYQRTLLLKLQWRPNEKARGTSRAPA